MGTQMGVGRMMIGAAVLLGTACMTWLGDVLGPWTSVPVLAVAALAAGGVALMEDARNGQ